MNKENLFWVAIDELTHSKFAKPIIVAFSVVSAILVITVSVLSVNYYRTDKAIDQLTTIVDEMSY